MAYYKPNINTIKTRLSKRSKQAQKMQFPGSSGFRQQRRSRSLEIQSTSKDYGTSNFLNTKEKLKCYRWRRANSGWLQEKNMVTFDPKISTVTFKELRHLKRAARGSPVVALWVEYKGSSTAGCQKWAGPWLPQQTSSWKRSARKPQVWSTPTQHHITATQTSNSSKHRYKIQTKITMLL